jgi:hypothetical protein
VPRDHLFKPGQSGNPKGRPKGIPNKATVALKDMIIGALDKAGGLDYLVRQAEENPGPFLSLVGKVLPTELRGPAADGSHRITFVVEGVPAPRRDESSPT